MLKVLQLVSDRALHNHFRSSLCKPNSLKIWKQHLSFVFLLNFPLTKTLDHFFAYPLKGFCQSKNNWFPTLIPETTFKYYTISVIQGLNSNSKKKKTLVALIHVKVRKTSNLAHLFKIINESLFIIVVLPILFGIKINWDLSCCKKWWKPLFSICKHPGALTNQ